VTTTTLPSPWAQALPPTRAATPARSTKWAVFLLSLKSLIETGKGAPDPHDVRSTTGTDALGALSMKNNLPNDRP
jgi:hypothetical protein